MNTTGEMEKKSIVISNTGLTLEGLFRNINSDQRNFQENFHLIYLLSL
jgi:hypothetical protein